MAKIGEEARLKTPKNSRKAGLKSQTPQENTTKMKIWKITKAKLKVRASTFCATIG